MKRLFDLFLAINAAIILLVPICIVAFLVKLTSKGPVIFKQNRYGLDGKKIKVYKFRSMTVQDNGDKVQQATKNDARITPLGAFLRKTSLDELPQFLSLIHI